MNEQQSIFYLYQRNHSIVKLAKLRWLYLNILPTGHLSRFILFFNNCDFHFKQRQETTAPAKSSLHVLFKAHILSYIYWVS